MATQSWFKMGVGGWLGVRVPGLMLTLLAERRCVEQVLQVLLLSWPVLAPVRLLAACPAFGSCVPAWFAI